MFCKHCGAQIPDDSELCPNCGAQLVAKTAPQAVEAPPQASPYVPVSSTAQSVSAGMQGAGQKLGGFVSQLPELGSFGLGELVLLAAMILSLLAMLMPWISLSPIKDYALRIGSLTGESSMQQIQALPSSLSLFDGVSLAQILKLTRDGFEASSILGSSSGFSLESISAVLGSEMFKLISMDRLIKFGTMWLVLFPFLVYCCIDLYRTRKASAMHLAALALVALMALMWRFSLGAVNKQLISAIMQMISGMGSFASFVSSGFGDASQMNSLLPKSFMSVGWGANLALIVPILGIIAAVVLNGTSIKDHLK